MSATPRDVRAAVVETGRNRVETGAFYIETAGLLRKRNMLNPFLMDSTGFYVKNKRFLRGSYAVSTGFYETWRHSDVLWSAVLL